MSQENVEIVKTAIDALNRKELGAAFHDAAPSFEIDLSRSNGPWSGVYGVDQFRRFMDEFTDLWDSMHIEPTNSSKPVIPWSCLAPPT